MSSTDSWLKILEYQKSYGTRKVPLKVALLES